MALCIGINALYYAVFLNRETDSELVPESPRFRGIRCPVRAAFRPARILFEQIRLPRMLTRHGIDVLLNPGFTAPLFARCPQVTVFHDLQHKIHPEFFRARDLPFWNILLAGSAACSSRLIAVSDSTARDLAECFPRAAGKIATVPHGVDPEFFEIGKRRREGPGRPFILVVSTLHAHKNLERAIEAYRRFRAAHPEYKLVIAGLKGFAATALQDRVGALGLSEDVEFTGWIPRSDLYALFSAASAFFPPSLFEGFGMPLVEALAAGIPTACSSIPTFCQIADGIACMFDPTSTDAMLEALETVTRNEDFRSRAILDGPARARIFDCDKAAEATLRELICAARITQPAHENIRETGAPPDPTGTVLPAPAPPASSVRKASPTP